MAEIRRSRTISPSSRGAKSKSYKVVTEGVGPNDTLFVTIDHETKPFRRTFQFNGKDVSGKDSISFRVIESGMEISITWSGDVRPFRIGPLETGS